MKWSIQQLRKIQKFPYHFSDTIDYSEYAETVEDIFSIEPVFVSGSIDKIDDEILALAGGSGTMTAQICNSVFYKILSENTGLDISNMNLRRSKLNIINELCSSLSSAL